MDSVENELAGRLAAAQQFGDHAAAGSALFELARAARHAGNFPLAWQRFGAAAAEFSAVGQAKNMLAALNNAATSAMALGDWSMATQSFRECLEIATRLGDGDAVRRAIGNLASVCSDADQVEDALNYHLMAMGMAQQLGDRLAEARSLHNAAWGCLRLRQFDRSQDYLARAGRCLEDSHELEVQAVVTLMQARLDMRARRWARAGHELMWADRALATVGALEWRSHAQVAIAILEELSGAASPVTDRLMAALPGLSSMSARHTTARRLFGLSCAAAELGRPTASQAYAGLAAMCADGARDPALRDLAGHVRDALASGGPVDQAAVDYGLACALELRPVMGEPPMPTPPDWNWLTIN